MVNWQTKKLSEICDFQRGLTYSKKDEVDFSESVVLRSNNIDLLNSLLNLDELRYINGKITIPENKKVKKGSIIICIANGSKSHLGKIALVDKDYGYAFGGFMGQLTPKKETDSKYFFYILTSDFYKKHLVKISSGANINNLKFSDLSELIIPLPPIPEQHRIVKILDEVFGKVTKVKENAEKNLKNSRELFESYLQSVFANPGIDWDAKRLGEVCDFFNGKAHEKVIDKNGEYIVVNSKFISSEGQKFKKTKKILFPMVKGDIAMVMSDVPKGKTLAKCFLVDKDNTYTLNQRICIFRSDKFDKKFLFYQLGFNNLTQWV